MKKCQTKVIFKIGETKMDKLKDLKNEKHKAEVEIEKILQTFFDEHAKNVNSYSVDIDVLTAQTFGAIGFFKPKVKIKIEI